MNSPREITPEMIEAGLSAYRQTRPGEASDFNETEVVTAIFAAMDAASDHFTTLPGPPRYQIHQTYLDLKPGEMWECRVGDSGGASGTFSKP